MANQGKPIWKRWWVWVIGACVLIGLIYGATGTASDTPPPAAPSKATPPADNCEAPSPELVAAIAEGGKAGALNPEQAAAFKSDTGDYFVAIRFDGVTGVWQTKNLQAGPIGSVNAVAKAETNWPDTGNAGSSAESKAVACIK